MKQKVSNGMIKQQNHIRTALYILHHNGVCRQDLADALGLSMPTVFQNVGYLIDSGLVCESGEYRSTGGRKAKILSICENQYCTVGVEVLRHHIQMTLTDISHRLMASAVIPVSFSNTPAYYKSIRIHLNEFLKRNNISDSSTQKLVGIGIALPGIIDHDRNLLVKSHALQVENLALCQFEQVLPCPVVFDNDANLAAYAEITDKQCNTLYLSLNETVGGAFYQGGKLYLGDNFKSCEFGHMILVPNGRKCYCGKKGCMDAYCSSRVLQSSIEQNPDPFFARLDAGDPDSARLWDTYLDYLSMMTANLRMAYDCKIVIGGQVGGNLQKHLPKLQEKLKKYNLFDSDSGYVSAGQFKQESVSIGAAWRSIEQFVQALPLEGFKA